MTDGIEQLIERLGVPPSEIGFSSTGRRSRQTLFWSERARAALVVTAGFRDLLQIGRQDRPDLYEWRIRCTVTASPVLDPLR